MEYTLEGVNANAYNIMGYVSHAMRECRKPCIEIDGYFINATSGDYNHLLATSMKILDGLNATQEDL
jgi:hypothetical protein